MKRIGLTVLDGGMGTLLQAKGLRSGECPEDWNVERPEDVAAIHRAYASAGSQIVYANTFGANRLKYGGRHGLEKVIRAGIDIARRSGAKVALDLGPTGRLLKPAGKLDFRDAVSAFAETVRLGAAADLVVIETMSDVRELKAAVLAAKENCDLPVYATVTLGSDGKLLTGGSVECVAALLESLDVDAYGFNCGLGPEQMLPWIRRLAEISTKPIIAKPNAGLPSVVEGKTVYTVDPASFAASAAKLRSAGASIVGGCCGTTPEHLHELTVALRQKTVVSSGTSVVELKPHAGVIIGERINPTGKKALKGAYKKGDAAYVLREAVKQVDAGAAVIDVNCGVAELDEAELMETTVEAVQSVVTCPIQVDTADPSVLERALRRVNGKPLVNSVNGKRKSMDAVFPLVRRYGGAIVALCLDESGIPSTADGRLAIARRILCEGAKYGFDESDFVFDALTLAVSSDPQAALVTLETVKRLNEELHVNTVLGVSNVSFGLPNRPALNNAMYALAKRSGLSAAIANPSVIRDEIDPAAEDVLLGRDVNCEKWISLNAQAAEKASAAAPTSGHQGKGDLHAAICRGLKDDARTEADEAIKAGQPPLEVIRTLIVPALERVGREFESGTAYLPQLLMAADAAGEAFAVVKRSFAASERRSARAAARPILLATVKGDIHDIGKNIVRALLENYGFEVIDLGRDVEPGAVVDAARKSNAMLVGLSALMTTTVGAMAETIRLLKAAKLGCRTVVGGAVVTQEFADKIGADFYAKDAMRTVRIAETLG